MLYKVLVKFICAASLACMLASCGDSKPSGTGEFSTVFATSKSAAITSADAGVLNLATVGPMLASYVISSTAYANANTGNSSSITASNLKITKVTITLAPANTSFVSVLPASVTPQFSPASPIILPVGDTSVDIQIDIDALKTFLATHVNAGASASFWVNVDFELHEISTDRIGSVSFPNSLKISFTNS
jgi:hypothetical protein